MNDRGEVPATESVAAAIAVSDGNPVPGDSAATLWGQLSFWGFTATQFLGAFNDNLFKQIVLLLFVAVPVPSSERVERAANSVTSAAAPVSASLTVPAADLSALPGVETRDLQWLALLMFSLPFILFSGYAGFLSERFSKTTVIRSCKLAEVLIMLLGTLCFWILTRQQLSTTVIGGLSLVLFLMGGHSAFFGPSKYGVLPELLPPRVLKTANGIIIMTTFLSIILGTGLAGLLMTWWRQELSRAGWVCGGLALLGVITSLLVRRTPAMVPDMPFSLGNMGVPRTVRELLRQDRPLAHTLTASTVFWLVAALVQPSVNALGKQQLDVGEEWTSYLVMTISLGIAIGSPLSGLVARRLGESLVPRLSLAGMVLSLMMLALPGGPQQQMLGYWGSVAALLVLGVFTGMFAVPMQVFLQARPPDGRKGQVIATQNLFNWIGIFLSAGIYSVGSLVVRWCCWPTRAMFALVGLILLPLAVAAWYLPIAQDLAPLAGKL
ncbi:MAG: MFS transporter [Planctomycetota bacterium]